MAIDINELLAMNPTTVTDKCKCNIPQPCWLADNQQDGAGLNSDGTTNGTGVTVEDLGDGTPSLENGEAPLGYSGITLLKVYHKEGTQSTYCIEFPSVRLNNGPDGLATSYTLYGSPSPINPEKILENWSPVDPTQKVLTMEYEVDVPFTSREIDWHFWVEAPVENGRGGLISTSGASVWTSERDWNIPANMQITMPLSYPTNAEGTVLDNSYLDFILQKNRADKMMILQSDGEPFDVYLRRWEGIPCPCSDNRASGDTQIISEADLDYNSRTNCPYCFGTGFLGGYYHRIRIFARYNNNPPRKIQYTAQGTLTSQPLQSWTLWTPPLRAHDLIVQCSTGDRFYVQDVSRTIVRSYIMDQQFNNAACQRSEIVYHVTNESIDNAFATYSQAFKPTDTIWG